MVNLQTERLVIRDYETNDILVYHELVTDKAAMYYMNDINIDSIEESEIALNDV